MTKQWHNPKVRRKPFVRFNPSLHEQIGAVYRPWYVVYAILSLLVGIVLIGCSATLKILDSKLKDELFHLWVGLPLVASGIFAIVCRVTLKKKVVIGFLIFALPIMILCSVGALISGVHFMIDYWKRVKLDLNNNNCYINERTKKCTCPNIPKTLMPAQVDNCDDLETMVNLVIAEMALNVFGFFTAVMGVYLAFMTICCAPWLYTEWYEEQFDPEFSKEEPRVQQQQRSGDNAIEPTRVSKGQYSNY